VVITLVASAAVAAWMYAPRLAEQSDQFAQGFPQAIADTTSWLRRYSWGRWLIDQFSFGASAQEVTGQATTAVRRLIDGVVAAAVILFTGLYLAAEPTPYIRGLLFLIPSSHRVRVAETLYAAGHVLRWWLIGQALAMVVVGVTMGIGLALIGVQLAFLLGVISGMFEFIPLVGPVLALGPALLVAMGNGTRQAASVVVLYSIVQVGESYVLTPLVQRKTLELPPVLTITAQVALGWAAGPVGLLVAVPLTAVVMVSIEMLYVEDRLRERVSPSFESAARADIERERNHNLRGVLPADDDSR
jgi:predicted PurR-regulated permease PerM